MRFLSLLLTLWLIYLLYRIIRPLFLFLLLSFWPRQKDSAPDAVKRRRPKPKAPGADKKIVDAEYEEIK